jgi:dihydroceramidase
MAVGFWEPHTGNPDWCEINYAWTIYIAEFWNTLSSLPLIFVGVQGLYHCYRYKYDVQFVVCNLVLLFVGIGSTAFHGSLSYQGQCLDELAMIYCALAFAYTIIPATPAKAYYGLALLTYAATFTFVYFHLKSSVYFQVCKSNRVFGVS